MANRYAILFANLKGNLGDFAILQSILADIHRRDPDAAIDVYSQPFVGVDKARTQAFFAAAPACHYKGTTEKALTVTGPGRIRFLRTLGLLRAYEERRIARHAAELTAAMAAELSAYHTVFIAGGAQWTGVDAGVSMFADLRAVTGLGVMVKTYPFSVSSSLFKLNTKARLAEDFRRITPPLIARDSQTHRMLEEIGVPTVLGADCVFALGPKPGSTALPVGQKGRLLFIVTKQSRTVLEPALRTALDAGFKPLLLTTCTEEDAAVQAPLAEALDLPFLAPLTWQEAVAEIEASELVITNRLHGLILSSFAPKPVIPLTDRPKVKAVTRDAGLPVSLDTLVDLSADRLARARAEAAEIAAVLGRYRAAALGTTWSPWSTKPRLPKAASPVTGG
ncbi:polysaccharide pyruvyl transferase family protein [Rhizobium sp. YIM 134829]|uniref:polysaccharide pyruvyl transferase family protein n=1 Tax=Rhizobium sp. YIM 134829 TaxID=3390453 RepID=UPI0039781736